MLGIAGRDPPSTVVPVCPCSAQRVVPSVSSARPATRCACMPLLGSLCALCTTSISLCLYALARLSPCVPAGHGGCRWDHQCSRVRPICGGPQARGLDRAAAGSTMWGLCFGHVGHICALRPIYPITHTMRQGQHGGDDPFFAFDTVPGAAEVCSAMHGIPICTSLAGPP